MAPRVDGTLIVLWVYMLVFRGNMALNPLHARSDPVMRAAVW
ncbi:protein of unknown function [Methylorubrum extorquens]|uniref:Uncharacterized protein n=1 Tax=Methylorubrum extorquens TaxID=408 RepID=A0A2N9ASE3_METEX|nr:protein of unknown function [Methylorubrum extorquens]